MHVALKLCVEQSNLQGICNRKRSIDLKTIAEIKNSVLPSSFNPVL